MADLLECLLQVKGLRETCDRLSSLVSGADVGRWTAAPADGGPSPADLLTLLVELEVAYGAWLRLVLAADRSPLPPMEAPSPLGLSRRRGWTPAEALDRFLRYRRDNLGLLDRCSAADFSRTASHATRREISIADLVALMMASDAERVGEIRRALAHRDSRQ